MLVTVGRVKWGLAGQARAAVSHSSKVILGCRHRYRLSAHGFAHRTNRPKLEYTL